MEGSLQDEHGIIRTNSYVLWTYELTSNISSNDGQHTLHIIRQRNSSGLHRRHPYIFDGRRITLKNNGTIIPNPKGQQPHTQTGEVHIREARSGILQCNFGLQKNLNGPKKD
jgi:hypothetical protein